VDLYLAKAYLPRCTAVDLNCISHFEPDATDICSPTAAVRQLQRDIASMRSQLSIRPVIPVLSSVASMPDDGSTVNASGKSVESAESQSLSFAGLATELSDDAESWILKLPPIKEKQLTNQAGDDAAWVGYILSVCARCAS